MSILPVSEAARGAQLARRAGRSSGDSSPGSLVEGGCRVCDPAHLNDRELHRVQKAGFCLIKTDGRGPSENAPPPRQGFFGPDCGSFLPWIISIVLVC